MLAAENVLAPVFAILWLGLAIFQVVAFIEGLDVWLGLNAFLSVIAFVVLIFVPLGSLAATIVAFVGATEGWRWEWWQAVLLLFPFPIISLVVMGVGGAIDALSRLTTKRAAVDSHRDPRPRQELLLTSSATSPSNRASQPSMAAQELDVQPAAEKPESFSQFHALTHHGEDAQRAYNSLSDLPDSYRYEFLRGLDENPSSNVDDLASFVRTKATVHELAEHVETESSNSAGDEAQAIEPVFASTSRAREKTDERVLALEAQVRELSAKADDWQRSAQAAAEDVQKRFTALEAELDALRRERDSLIQQAELAQKSSRIEAQKFRALKREILAAIFLVGLAVIISFFNKWPAGFWEALSGSL